MRKTTLALALGLAVPVLAAPASKDCPAPVTDAARAAHPGAGIQSCAAEREGGKLEYELTILKAGKRLELRVDPSGKLLATEEPVPLPSVPPTVIRALASRYPGAQPTEAERRTMADGRILYEVEFRAGAARKSATLSEDGTWVGEEDERDEDEKDDD